MEPVIPHRPTMRCSNCHSTAAVGYDSDLKVLGQANDVFCEILAAETFSQTSLGMGYEDLRDLVFAGEVHDDFGYVPAGNDASLNLQTSGKT